MDKLVMGYWDCQYCGTSHIKGTKRDCPNCDHPRDAGVKFYMDESNVQYLTPEEAKTKGKGADWLCSFCNNLNSVLDNECKSCGASKEDSEKNYFEIKQERMKQKSTDKPDTEIYKELKPESREESPVTEEKPYKQWFRKIGIFLLTFLICTGLIYAVLPKTKEFIPQSFEWNYEINVESLETVDESDWTLPSEARLKNTKQEFHHYQQVLDHYETKTRTYTVQVPDGYDISYSYSDNGDGTFSQHETKTPKYRSETKTETYQDPVYRQDPVYQTKYYYEIDKWLHKRYVETSGTDKKPYWGELNLEEKEREGKHKETYHVKGTVKGEIKTYSCSKEIWEQLEKGGTYKVSVSPGGEIIEIK